MQQKQEQETSTKKPPSTIKDAFYYGFFSTLGMLAMISVYANREKIKRVIRYAIQEAG